MYDSVIKFQPYSKDIFIGGEIVKLASYKEREQEIFRIHMESHDNNIPDKKMRYIRLGVFPVMPHTTINDLKALCNHIREEFKIDAFQMAIAPKRRRAYVLFDWYDRKTCRCIQYYETFQKRLNAVILHDLGLALGDDIDEKLLKSFLKENFKQNPDVFNQVIDELRHKHLTKKTYSLVKYIVVYIEKLCKGELK